MNFVEVMVADPSYHQKKLLTYCSAESLIQGSIVEVNVRGKNSLAVVIKIVKKPDFAVKPINSKLNIPVLPVQLLQLVDWIKDYYPAPLGILAQLILPKKMPSKNKEIDNLPPVSSDNLPPLTKDQKKALAQIDSNAGLFLLHGETGSGKTRVYVELAKQALARGESSIILTPEIGLTSQLAKDFRRVFGNRVVLVHSGLTESTRLQTWRYILENGQALIIIGARSALFSPINNLGLIVVDESHETAYKQDQSPYYQTSSVAAKLASLHKAKVVLGSATPSITDYYFATIKNRPIISMSQPAVSGTTEKSRINLVDLKDKNQFSSSPYVSNPLIESIKQSLANNKQSLVFLNRRGTARVVLCEKCGWQSICPNCDLPLIYHGDNHSVRCHSCSFKSLAPNSCPSCGNASIVFRSIGTKALTQEVSRLFPNARVMRFDNDNKKNERIEENYDSVHRGDVDILVGTQTLAKGLDLPKLATLGVVAADTSLYLPDFSSQERTYQLLHQVIGRVERGHQSGQIVIQTFQPNSQLIKSVLNRDWHNFYNNELEERHNFLFPPFCYLLKLTCKRASSSSAQKAAQELVSRLKETYPSVKLEGPAPSFHEKVQGKFVWQVIVKSKQRTYLTGIINKLPSGWTYDIDPLNLL